MSDVDPIALIISGDADGAIAAVAALQGKVGSLEAQLKALQAAGTGAGRGMSAMGGGMAEARVAAGALMDSTGMMSYGFMRLLMQSPALSAALQAAFPVIGAVALVEVLSQLYESIQNQIKKVQEMGVAYNTWASSAVKSSEDLYTQELKLEDETRKLFGLPSVNVVAIAADEARQKLMEMDQQIQKNIADLIKMMDQNNIGIFTSLITGDVKTSGITDAVKNQALQTQEAMTHLSQARNQLELDTEQKLGAAKLKADQEQINAAQQIAQIQITALQKVIAEQAASLEKQKASWLASDKKSVFGEGSDDITARFKPAEDMLTSLSQGAQAFQATISQTNKISGDIVQHGKAEALKEQTDYLKQQAEELARLDEATQKNLESFLEWGKSVATAEGQASKAGEATYEAMQRELRAQVQAQKEATSQIIDSIKLQIAQKDAALDAAERGAKTEKSGWGESVFGNVAGDRAQLAALADEINQVKVDMNNVSLAKSQLADQMYVTPEQQAEIDRLAALYDELLRKLEQLKTKQNDVANDMTQQWQKAFDRMNQTFNSNFLQFVNRSQSFGRAMQKVWTSMADQFIESCLRMAEHWVESELMKLAATKTAAATGTAIQTQSDKESQLSSAKAAAAGAYKAMAGIPIVGPILGAAAAATVFAAALAFEQGGLIPGTGAVPVIAHGGEMVLPAHLSSFIQSAAASQTRQGGGGVHVNVRYGDVNSGNDFKEQLSDHADHIAELVHNVARRRGLV